eukprot:Opistho-2@66971
MSCVGTEMGWTDRLADDGEVLISLDRVPNEVASLIFAYLNPDSLAAVARTGRRWRSIVYSNDSFLWRRHCTAHDWRKEMLISREIVFCGIAFAAASLMSVSTVNTADEGCSLARYSNDIDASVRSVTWRMVYSANRTRLNSWYRGDVGRSGRYEDLPCGHFVALSSDGWGHLLTALESTS